MTSSSSGSASLHEACSIDAVHNQPHSRRVECRAGERVPRA